MADGKVTILTALSQEGFEQGLAKLDALTVAAGKVIADTFEAAVSKVAEFATSAVQAGMNFDAAMSQVAATMGTTVDQITDLREFAQQMGSTTSFSATQAAEALNYMALAGYDATTSMTMLPNVLNLAAAGGMELATASDMVTDASSALGLSLDDTKIMVDQMAKASSKTNTSVSQLGDAILTVGGTAKTLSGGTNELATVLGLLADNGIKASEGGTHLRNILLAMNPTTDAAAGAWKALGVSGYDANGNLRPLQDTFADLSKAMEGMSDQEKTDLISSMFNKTDISSVNALLATNAERWNEVSDAIENSAGAAEDMANTQLDNLAGDITLFQSALEGAEIALSDKLTPALRNVVKFGSDSLSALTSGLKNGNFGSVAVGIVTDLLNGITQTISSKSDMMVTAGLAAMLNFARGITSSVGSIGGSVLTIISAIGQKITTNGADIAVYGSLILNNLICGLSSGITAITGVATEWINGISSGFVSGIPTFLSNVLPVVTNLSASLRANAGQLVDAGLNMLLNLAQGIANSIPTIVQYAPIIIQNLAGIINDNAPKILATGVQIVVTLAKGLVQAIPVIISNMGNIVKAVAAVLMAFNWLSIGSNVITLIQKGMKALAKNIPTALKSILTTASNTVKSINWLALGKTIITTIRGGISALASSLPSVLKSIATTAFNVVKSINWLSLGKTIITLVKNGVTALVSVIPNALKSIGSSAVTAFKSIAWGALGKNIITGIIAGITGAAGQLLSKMKNLASSALEKAKSALGIHSPSKVFRDEVGQWIPKGIASGIQENIDSVLNATSDMGKKVASSVSKADGEKTGENYAKSIINGIKKSKKYAKKSASVVGNAIVSTAEKKLKNYQTTHDTTVAYEVGFWKKIVKSCKKGTQAYYDAYSNYSDALKSYNDGKKKAKEELISLETDYANDVANVETQLVSDLNDVWDTYYSTVESRSKELYKSLGGLFSAFSSKTSNTTSSMISNMKSQVDGMTTWQDNLLSLKNRGLNESLLSELQDLGPEAAADVAVLASMTDSELESYVQLWQEKMNLCNNQAIEESKPLYDSTLQQVEQLKKDANAEIEELTKSFVESVQKLSTDTLKELGTLPAGFKSVGKDAINGITTAIKNNSGSLTKEVTDLMSDAVKAAKTALKIKSPSRVFRDEVGVQISAGIASGIDRASDDVFDAMDGISDGLADYDGVTDIPVGFSVSDSINLNDYIRQLTAGMSIDNIKMAVEAYSDAVESNIHVTSSTGNSGFFTRLDKLAAMMEELIDETGSGHDIVLDDGTLVGKMTSKIDVALGKRKTAMARS